MLSYAISGVLNAAKEQLENMQAAKTKSYVLDALLVGRIISFHSKQNDFIPDEKALCVY